jgi:flagellar hook assembly protein FlgD
VYNLAGQLVATLIDKQLPQGKYTVQWNGRDMNGKSVASGMYFVKMKAADFEKVNKIMLLK